MNQKYVSLSDFYKKLLYQMLKYNFPGKTEVASQISTAKARPMNRSDSYGSIEFLTDSPKLASVEKRIPIELEATDKDGVPIAVLLFVDEGKINYLEIYKADGSQIIDMPSPEKFTKPKWKKLSDDTWTRAQRPIVAEHNQTWQKSSFFRPHEHKEI